jgi:hypothetical protein
VVVPVERRTIELRRIVAVAPSWGALAGAAPSVRYRCAMRLIWMLACLSTTACGEKALSDYMDDDVPAGKCEDTDASLCETGGQGDECEDTQFCTGELVCAAPFDGDIGAFKCQSSCVETMDETRWCTDAASCCEIGAVCGPRGYCMLPEGVDTGSDDTTGGSSTSTGVDTGTGTTAGASTETGTSTDAGTGTDTGTSSDTTTSSDTDASTGVTSG